MAYEEGAHSPEFIAFAAAACIEGNRENIEKDGVTLIGAVSLVLDHGLRPPKWLAMAFRKRWHRFNAFETRTLDEAFEYQPSKPKVNAAMQSITGRCSKVQSSVRM